MAATKPVFVITGTSGEGKSTLARRLVERMPELQLAVSATTRPQRPGEVDGRDYRFISEEEFDRRLAEHDFLESVQLPWGPGYRSGTLLSEVERIRGEGRAPLLEIETKGALAVRDRASRPRRCRGGRGAHRSALPAARAGAALGDRAGERVRGAPPGGAA